MNHHPSSDQIRESMYQIAEAALEPTSLQVLFQTIHTILDKVIRSKNFSIALYDSETQVLHFPFWVDEFNPTPEPRTLRKGLTEYVIRSGEPQLLKLEEIEQLVKKGIVEHVGCLPVFYLGVPLKIWGSTIGALVIQSYTPDIRYDEEDEKLLKFISNQIVMAIGREKMESHIQASDVKFRSIFEHACDGIYQTTPQGKIVTANPALVNMLGYASEQELLQVDIASDLYVNPGEREYWSIILEEQGLIKNAELHLRKKDGEPIIVLENAYAVRDAAGKVLYHEGILTDVAELTRAREELEIQRAYFEQLFQSQPEAIVILDNEDRVLRTNKGFAKLFGYEQAEILNRPINELIVPPSMRDESLLITKSVAEGNNVGLETVRQRNDGTLIHVSILGTPIYIENGQVGVYGIYRDISERKHRETERENLLNDIQDALRKVKTLSGLLPICASCKKVRDDNGYWNQIESYITDHSNADFTHGICPDCAKKLYGSYTKKD